MGPPGTVPRAFLGARGAGTCEGGIHAACLR